MFAVGDRSEETLINCIKSRIKPKTVIISDCWKAYQNLTSIPDFHYKHLTVNHSKNFVDPQTSAHTQKIEATWQVLKVRNKRHRGTRRGMVDSYICEFIWRQRHKNNEDLFKQILKDISNFQ